jgi:hypothetical protein
MHGDKSMAEDFRVSSDEHPKMTAVEARQGTGPRDMVSVLLISLLLAAVVGAVIVGYFRFMT